jgi:hypothetical protein
MSEDRQLVVAEMPAVRVEHRITRSDDKVSAAAGLGRVGLIRAESLLWGRGSDPHPADESANRSIARLRGAAGAFLPLRSRKAFDTPDTEGARA